MTNEELSAHRIYCFARWIWPRRNELAPNEEAGRKWMWGEIFKRRTGQSLDEYAHQRIQGNAAIKSLAAEDSE